MPPEIACKDRALDLMADAMGAFRGDGTWIAPVALPMFRATLGQDAPTARAVSGGGRTTCRAAGVLVFVMPGGHVETMAPTLARGDRVASFRSYCAGPLSGDRKALSRSPRGCTRDACELGNQSLHHFVAKADKPDDTMVAAEFTRLEPSIDRYQLTGDGITEVGLAYVLGVQSSTRLWPPAAANALGWQCAQIGRHG